MDDKITSFLEKQGIKELRPAQIKALKAGVLDGNNVLVCTPTASGKTLIAEMTFIKTVREHKIGLYVVPLKALASEKLREFRARHDFKVGMSVGDLDESDSDLGSHDIIVVTAEKLDSLLRHHSSWLSRVGVVVVDEIHLLNDPSRGPTLEILITMLRRQIKPQIIGLSATIGNPVELSEWLGATLVSDSWRPVRLEKGIFYGDKVHFPEKPY